MNRFAPSTFKWGNGAAWSYGDTLRSRKGLGRLPTGLGILSRAIAVCLLVVATCIFPWWLTLSLAFAFFMIFNFPIEAILAVIALDVLSGGIYFAAGVIVLLPLMLWLKRRLRF